MPTHSRKVAFVVVMHLAPERESHLAELLQPHCPMPVQQSTGDVALEANHVYLIRPGANLNTIDTHLRLSALEQRRQERAPIDHFFRTRGARRREPSPCSGSCSRRRRAKQLVIRWVEQGGPTVTEPQREGFGSKVITHTVQFELQGETKVRYDPDGLRCTLRIPWTPSIGYRIDDEGRDDGRHD